VKDFISFTVHPLPPPEPLDEQASASDRAHFVQEQAAHEAFPFEVVVEAVRGDQILYGDEARAWLVAWCREHCEARQ
jgi:hypothetical protein